MLKLLSSLIFLCVFAAVLGETTSESEPKDGQEENLLFYDKFRQETRQRSSDEIRFEDASSGSLAHALGRIVSGKPCHDKQVYCNVSCAHGKLLKKSSGCCLCTCARGHALAANRKGCLSVSWTTWGTWSTCITSDWGGLQTRERICKHEGVTKNSRCVGAGSESRTCSSVTKPYRIRKNIRILTDAEKHDLIQAYTKFKNDNSSDGFLYIVRWHGWPFECPWYKHIAGHSNGHCSWHGHPMFLAWHRIIIVQLEMGMNKYLKDKSLGFPYWDWTEKGWKNLPDLFRLGEVFDPIINQYVKNPFYSTVMTSHKPIMNETAHTYRWISPKGLSWYDLLLRSVIYSLNHPTYETMENILESPHNQIHNCLCTRKDTIGDKLCLYSMLSVSYSAFDPVFALHHSQIDRLWALYKTLHDAAADQDWTNSSFVGSYVDSGQKMTSTYYQSFDFPMSPFCNATMNPNKVTLNDKVWTVRNSFYYKQLFGYEFDSFDLSGDSWMGLVDDLKAKQRSPHYGTVLPFVSKMAPYLGRITAKNTKFADGCSIPKAKKSG